MYDYFEGPGRKRCPSLNLTSLLGHIAGNSIIPLLGFSPFASIAFVIDESLLPRAHTCINQLVLERMESSSTIAMNQFKDKLDCFF